MANLLGKNQILFIFDSESGGTGAYLPVGCLTTNALNKTNEYKDGTMTKCDLSPDPIPGKSSYEITFDGVAIESDATKVTYNRVSEIMDESHANNTPIFWKIETTLSNNTKETEFGKARLSSLNREAPVDGEVTFSGTLVGIGKISATDLHV